ncbi:MFS transporter [Alkalibaculum sp. M08DMB]|uniref:MFS transporter n=1 Tax=Alkalibaculum sporogenes TaxID=2655001 RepID=A0A6A7KCI4_9FIRM|nr:MFS transporter [Alkalibaculum sporogenes]MPW27106.1 MFS transporter [Alkalibaculum sporogenes]
MNEINNKTIILIISTLGAFWAPFITSSVNIALPHIGSELQLSSSLLNWVTSSTILAIAIFVLPAGKISDIFDRKKVMLVGTIILLAGSFFCGISQSVSFLLFSRVIQGLGSAMISTTVISIVCSAFPTHERGKALGMSVACTYIGLSAGPILGGFIISFTSWRGIFFSSLPVGIILIILLSKVLTTDSFCTEEKVKFDSKGTLLYGFSIFMLVFGLSNLLLYSWSKYILVFGFIFLLVFVYFESKIDNPILNVMALKSNRVLIFSSCASLINYSSTFAISYLMSLYLQVVKNLDPGIAGMVLLTQPALQAFLSPLAGRLSDKISPQILSSSGMALIAICLFSFGFLSSNTNIIIVIFLLGIVGMGFALFSSPNTNAIMSSVEKEYYGIASGIIGTARTVGQSFSMSLTALVSSIYLGNLPISRETIPGFMMSFKTSFIILSFLCILGVFASLARGRSIQSNT